MSAGIGDITIGIRDWVLAIHVAVHFIEVNMEVDSIFGCRAKLEALLAKSTVRLMAAVINEQFA
jgi:hypothetical protein